MDDGRDKDIFEGLEWGAVTPQILGAAITEASRVARRRHDELRRAGLCPLSGGPTTTTQAVTVTYRDGGMVVQTIFDDGCVIEESTGLPLQPRPGESHGKVTDANALSGNPQNTWGNTILHRLAVALGYQPDPAGGMTVDPDKVLAEAIARIERAQ